MAKVEPRIAYRRLENFVSEHADDLPPLDEWQDVTVRHDGGEQWTLTVDTGGIGDHKVTFSEGELSINDLYAATEYTIRGTKPFDPGDLTIDSPGKGDSGMTAKERAEMPSVAEAMRRADEAIGGRDKLGVGKLQPEPGLGTKLVRSLKKLVHNIRMRL